MWPLQSLEDHMIEPATNIVPPYRNRDDAPFIYFDAVAANGILAGAIEVELCARILTPLADSNDVLAEFISTARLRCSPNAANHLIQGRAIGSFDGFRGRAWACSVRLRPEIDQPDRLNALCADLIEIADSLRLVL
jgi:hypothetical protein